MTTTTTPAPQLYLITPPATELLDRFDEIAALITQAQPACLRLPAEGSPEDLGRAADQLRDLAHGMDIAVVIEDHVTLVRTHGLDGVHLRQPDARKLRDLRKDWGEDAILGASAHLSRHDGMAIAEAGGDYVSFAPLGETTLGDGARVDPELLRWWSEMIEVPCVVEGALGPDEVALALEVADFLAIGPEIWGQPDPAAALEVLWPAAKRG